MLRSLCRRTFLAACTAAATASSPSRNGKNASDAATDPRNASAFAQLAYAEAKLGRLADARQHVGAALALDPAEPMARQLAAAIR